MTRRHYGAPLGVSGYAEQPAYSCRIRRLAAHTLATTGTNVYATVPWDAKVWDLSGIMWSPAVPTTIFAPVSGVYLGSFDLGVTGSAWSGYYTMAFTVNGAQRNPIRQGESPGNWEMFNMSQQLLLNAGDAVTTQYEKRDAADSMNLGSGFALTLLVRG